VFDLKDDEPRERLGLLFVACSAALTPAVGHPSL